jgi:DNA primase
MRFTPEFIDELKARLKPSDVIGRYVKLKKRGQAYWGLSPFKTEKTPSFSVDDRRGTYHCFATGQHGDIITFLTEVQKLSFPEAVEKLAAEAGMELPRSAPEDAERREKRKGLIEAHATAAAFYEAMLRRTSGRVAADYLKRRGVTAEQIAFFRIGYAPDEHAALRDHLVNKGYTEETLVAAGLLAKPEEGGAAYDRFRGRVMFPILGSRDEIVAFGGRALDPEARAKYLNSPETPIFRKGETLYNYGAARQAAAAESAPLIVCEGYMDVIALWGAGFKRTVAPLGTALTESQLALLWRACDEPILCFDGDAAGVGAAFRAVDRALPILKPGKSLSFVFLPDNQDPDDIVRAGGAPAFRKAMHGAMPLIDVLWRRETEARPLDTPERRAALRAHLRDLVKAIADKDVRDAYGAELARRLDGVFAAPRRDPARPFDRRPQTGRDRKNPWAPPPRPSLDLKRRGAPSAFAREATLVLAALRHPELVERRESDFARLALENRDLARLMSQVLSTLAADPGLDSAGLQRHLHATGTAGTLERILRDEALNRQSFLRPMAETDEVERGFADALRHHLIATQARRDLAERAAQSFAGGEDAWKAAVTAREELRNQRGAQDAGEDGASETDLAERLERMRASVSRRRRR